MEKAMDMSSLTMMRRVRMNKGGFSWRRFLGITALKQNIARKTGVPTSRSGREAKVGRMILNVIFGKKR